MFCFSVDEDVRKREATGSDILVGIVGEDGGERRLKRIRFVGRDDEERVWRKMTGRWRMRRRDAKSRGEERKNGRRRKVRWFVDGLKRNSVGKWAGKRSNELEIRRRRGEERSG